jgi:hypothetical protein
MSLVYITICSCGLSPGDGYRGKRGVTRERKVGKYRSVLCENKGGRNNFLQGVLSLSCGCFATLQSMELLGAYFASVGVVVLHSRSVSR